MSKLVHLAVDQVSIFFTAEFLRAINIAASVYVVPLQEGI